MIGPSTDGEGKTMEFWTKHSISPDNTRVTPSGKGRAGNSEIRKHLPELVTPEQDADDEVFRYVIASENRERNRKGKN